MCFQSRFVPLCASQSFFAAFSASGCDADVDAAVYAVVNAVNAVVVDMLLFLQWLFYSNEF